MICTVLLTVGSQFYGGKINEPDSYSTTNKPQDVFGARSALGYDKYERQPVEHAPKDTKYPFGNNWEQFDSAVDYHQHNNFPYNG